ncbi:hypothetical protein PFISCL1PPCAC_14909, partial [Pristionchus fissidentatus]
QAIIGTRPGEAPFKLKLEPKDHVYLPWTKDTTYSTTIALSNPTKDIQMYKLKCTDNNVFRVQPPMGFLDPAASVQIKVYQYAKTRPEENKHFLMFLHQVATAADKNSKKDPAKIWKGDAAADGVTRMQAHFEQQKTTKTTMSKVKDASVEEKKSPRRKSQKSLMTAPAGGLPSKEKTIEPKKVSKKKPAVRKKNSANSKQDGTTATAEEKTTF